MKQSAWVALQDKVSGDILILKRSNKTKNKNQWCLPGGSKRKRGGLTNLAIKELKEETGVDIDKEIFTNKAKKHIILTKKKNYVIFKIKVNRGDINIEINEESKDYKWVNPILLLTRYKLSKLHNSLKIYLILYGKRYTNI